VMGHSWIGIDADAKQVVYWLDLVADALRHGHSPLITTAIRRAAHNQRLAPGAIFHTDRAATTPPMILGPCSRHLISDAQPGVPVSATTTRWPNRSSPR